MSYKMIRVTDIQKLDADYKDLKDSVDNESELRLKEKVAEDQKKIVAQVVKALALKTKTAEANLKEHETNVKKWHAEALSLAENAKVAAVAFRKKPGDEVTARTAKNFVDEVSDRKTKYVNDSQAYGAAWADLRGWNKTNLPTEAAAAFNTARIGIINGQQTLIALGNQIVEAEKEAKAQLAILAKASMKKDIKGGAKQRDISLAVADAKQVALDLQGTLADLISPANLTTKPSSITQAAVQLGQIAKADNMLQDKHDYVSAQSMWSNVELANKTMLTKAASMEKVLATRTRGFRTNELADSGVKTQLKLAAKAVSDAKVEVKKYATSYANAKKAFGVIQAKAKKLKLA